jgi:hypothetical protein
MCLSMCWEIGWILFPFWFFVDVDGRPDGDGNLGETGETRDLRGITVFNLASNSVLNDGDTLALLSNDPAGGSVSFVAAEPESVALVRMGERGLALLLRRKA